MEERWRKVCIDGETNWRKGRDTGEKKMKGYGEKNRVCDLRSPNISVFLSVI